MQAAAADEGAAKSFANIQEDAEEQPSNTEDKTKDSGPEEDGYEKEKLISALNKLENASEDTFLSQASH